MVMVVMKLGTMDTAFIHLKFKAMQDRCKMILKRIFIFWPVPEKAKI